MINLPWLPISALVVLSSPCQAFFSMSLDSDMLLRLISTAQRGSLTDNIQECGSGTSSLSGFVL